MKILVPIKRVIDPYVKIRVKSDESGVETHNVKMAINPFDEIAIEEALRIKEAGKASEVIVVSIGAASCQESLRQGLALGADRAIHILTEAEHCSLSIAKILEKIVREENPALVLMGKQSIDGDNNQTPQMLAALLDWPQATYASKLIVQADQIEAAQPQSSLQQSIMDKDPLICRDAAPSPRIRGEGDNEGGYLEVTREIDGGLETLLLSLPAVVSTDLRLNEPRYASLPNIMKAKQKPLEKRELDSLGLELAEHIKIISVKAPAVRTAGTRLNTVEELADILRRG